MYLMSHNKDEKMVNEKFSKVAFTRIEKLMQNTYQQRIDL